MKSASDVEVKTIDLRPFKESLRKKLSPDSPVLEDLLSEPNSMPVTTAEILIPHYLKRLERELEECGLNGPLVLRS